MGRKIRRDHSGDPPLTQRLLEEPTVIRTIAASAIEHLLQTDRVRDIRFDINSQSVHLSTSEAMRVPILLAVAVASCPQFASLIAGD